MTATALLLLLATIAPPESPGLSFDRSPGRLTVRLGDAHVADYVWDDPIIRRPYLARLATPGGLPVTRALPPREGVDATDHATMHPGLWLGFGDLNGVDFWRNKGVVKHASFVHEPATHDDEGTFTVRNEYRDGDRLLALETCRLSFRPTDHGVLILWDSAFEPAPGGPPLVFGDQEEMGLGVRVATPITVTQGGQILDADGRRNEPEVWGHSSDWCDYSRSIDGTRVGITLFGHPSNFRRPWFHARDYGVLVANPFGRKAFTGGEPSRVVVEPGQSLRLRFGALVHEGEVDLPTAYRGYLEAEPVEGPHP